VGRGLVGDHIDRYPSTQQLGHDGGGVAHDANGKRAPFRLCRHREVDRVVQGGGHGVEVAGDHPAVQAPGIDVDDEAHATVHGDRERLRATHPATAGGERQRPGEGATEPFRGNGGEGLIGALEDPLGADVDPGAGGHLAVHGQAELLQAAELRPVGPVGDQVGVGDEHPGSPFVGAEDPDRPAGLDQHGLITVQCGQCVDEGVERWPVARRLTRPAVDHEIGRALGHRRIEVVAQHPQGGLLRPPARGEPGTPGCSDRLHLNS
jgi:hypothetical protein